MLHAQAESVGVYCFEDLRVWQAPKRQTDLVGHLIRRPLFVADHQLSAQLNEGIRNFVCGA